MIGMLLFRLMRPVKRLGFAQHFGSVRNPGAFPAMVGGLDGQAAQDAHIAVDIVLGPIAKGFGHSPQWTQISNLRKGTVVATLSI